jgi:hypothetical protein
MFESNPSPEEFRELCNEALDEIENALLVQQDAIFRAQADISESDRCLFALNLRMDQLVERVRVLEDR